MAHSQKLPGPDFHGNRKPGGSKSPRKKVAPAKQANIAKKALAAGKSISAKQIKKPRIRAAPKTKAPTGHGASIIPLYAQLVGPDPVVAIRSGLPTSAADDIMNSGAITTGEFHDVVMPRKTLANRRAAGSLTPDQSDRLVRVVRVIAKAEQTFGNPEKAHRWLRRPTTPLAGEAPLNLLDTEAGARQVEELLIRIDHGIAA